MSIHDYIADGIATGGLVEFQPLRPRTVVRRIIMNHEVQNLTMACVPNPEPEVSESQWRYRCGYVQGDFDHFLNGKRITVALDPSSDAEDCWLKRLCPIEDGIFEIRHRSPPPGIRVFGRFAETNIFVALHWAARKGLGRKGDPAWAAAMAKCRENWGIFFGSEPFKSGELSDYISRKAFPV